MDNKIINFYSTREDYGLFSNFASYPIDLDGLKWKTVEHYFQAQKFEDETIKLKIHSLSSPTEVTKVGRSTENPIRKDWEEIKDSVMKKAVLAKVMQHPKVKKALLNTENATLVEHTKNDSYWGDGGDGSGKNMLGKILMEIRDELARDK